MKSLGSLGRLLPYLTAIAFVAAAALIQFGLTSIGATAGPFAAFYPAVAFAFAFGGLGPGVTAILACAVVAGALPGSGRDAIGSIVVFLLSSGLIGSVVARLRSERETASAQSRDAAAQLSFAAGSARLGVWRFDPGSKRIFFSPTFAEHFGLPAEAGSIGDDAISSLIHPDDRELTDTSFMRAVAERTDFSIEHRVIWPDGSEHWIHGCGRPHYSPDGRLLRVDGLTIDITDRKRIERNYSTSMATIQAAFQSASEAILIADTKGNVIRTNEGVRLFCRIRPGEESPTTYADFIALLEMSRLDGVAIADADEPYYLALQGKRQTLELKFRRRDGGEEFYGLVSFGPIYGVKGEIIGAVITAFDITELKQLQGHLEELVRTRTSELTKANETLAELSRHDALTGLFNRLAANERLHAEFERMKRTGDAYGVLMLDIDFFKNVNDSCGHRVGDEVLVLIARTLAGNLREIDFVARWGGEEFLILLPSTTLEESWLVAEKLRRAVEATPHPLARRITISIGAAVASPDDLDEDIAVMVADQRLYAAKHAGRNRVVAQCIAA